MSKHNVTLRPALAGPYHCEWDEKAQAFRIWDSPPDENGSHFMEIATLHCPDQPSYQSHQPAHAKLLTAAAELLAALRQAVEFINGHNECLEPSTHSGDREWIEYCVALHKSCQEAINKAEGRGE